MSGKIVAQIRKENMLILSTKSIVLAVFFALNAGVRQGAMSIFHSSVYGTIY